MTVRGDKASLRCGAEVGSGEHTRFLIAREDAEDTNVLVLRFPDGRTALPVFGREEEAGMFSWLETAGEGWRVAEFTRKDLANLLHDSCANVQQIICPFTANTAGKGPETVGREDFLRTLSDEQPHQDKEANHELTPLSPIGSEGFW